MRGEGGGRGRKGESRKKKREGGGGGGGGGAQCVELALRWQFCAHGSICHEIYF